MAATPQAPADWVEQAVPVALQARAVPEAAMREQQVVWVVPVVQQPAEKVARAQLAAAPTRWAVPPMAAPAALAA
jgi:hypothetical protein